jgi:ribonucleoside-diphosphate reductase alpha chain
VYASIEWSTRSSRISNSDGSTVFEMTDAEIPATWSQLATDIVVSKYFRKAGVPQIGTDGQPKVDASGKPVLGPERSVKQVVHRLAGCWRHWGEKFGYFASAKDAQAFYDEIAWMLLNQVAAPNSPQWFNTGLNYAYGISGPAQGHWITDHATGTPSLATDAYTHPQPHACFIQAVADDLVGEGGIMDLWTREARLFKYGSGTGTNFSSVRGENESLSGGGKSSGLMSFLKIGDRAAGAIKSGGTTRRAAKMVCLDVDHPDVEAFVSWKVREELKVAALVEGAKHFTPEQKETAQRLGLKLDYDFNGESYYTVSGQNSNNSVRLSDAFMEAVDADADWNLIRRTDGKVAKNLKARDLWNQISFAAWRCADPGLQYDSTINAWHTCPNGGRINASNPCSEYMFLDNTACNLASINLLKLYDPETRNFDLEAYEHAISLWTVVLEISVLMAAFPSKEIAERSWKYRTLGLGYANLGALLMQAGIPYDSDEGRALCGAFSAILTGRSYAASALLAAEHGAFDGFAENREEMLRVIRNHRRAAYGTARDASEWESLRIRPVSIDHGIFKAGKVPLANAGDMLARSLAAWDDALLFGTKFGFRNAQVTVIAPTGTIGLLMDCDTTGVEPDFALTKFKKLAGGGYFKIANQSLRPAMKALGYSATQTDEILAHVMGTLNLDTPMPDADGRIPATGPTFRQHLTAKGYTGDNLVALENQLPMMFELGFAFSAWSMPTQVLEAAGLDPAAAKADGKFNGLKVLGLKKKQIESLNRRICGTQTVEGAPHLKAEHLAVFDCANKCGPTGTRFIRPEGHIHMMAAAQPFISGAISKTINMASEATVEQIGDAYRMSWELGLKANALYRDGSKLSQPLSTKTDVEQEDEDTEGLEESATAGEPVASAASSQGATRAAAVPATSTSTTSFESPVAEESSVLVEGDRFVERIVERVVERVIERPMRRRLNETRGSITHKFNVAGHEGYLIVGLYEDGRPGELFITMAKEGSTIGGLMDSLGTAISVALQYGVPVESLVNKFAHQRFEPMGMTTNSDIPFAKSLVDYIFRWMGMQFIAGYRDQNAPRRPASVAAPVTAEPLADHHGRGVKEDTAWQHRTEGASARLGDRISSSDMGASGSSTDSPRGSERIASILSETTQITESDVSTSAHSDGVSVVTETTVATKRVSVLDQATATLMGDAPACDGCGSITVRNGTCYRCLNCGNSMGCS